MCEDMEMSAQLLRAGRKKKDNKRKSIRIYLIEFLLISTILIFFLCNKGWCELLIVAGYSLNVPIPGTSKQATHNVQDIEHCLF